MTALLLLVSCSHQKTISTDKLRSEITSAASFAAEAEAFIDYALQGRTIRNFADGHMVYLADEANRSAKELHEAVSNASHQQLLECRKQLDSLANELAAARLAIGRPDVLAGAKQRIGKLRKAFEEIKASL
jgi:hypothetical protein